HLPFPPSLSLLTFSPLFEQVSFSLVEGLAYDKHQTLVLNFLLHEEPYAKRKI
uniref:Uncharacterized protein n=1 Tax=Amphimedon queenslandica TaxID=400682 RepID=A0A1X7V957_AMPQE